MNIEEKRLYIYNNVSNIQNSRLILNFIKENNIEYSKNKNGIYFNLTCLNDDLINNFYDYIFLAKDNELDQENHNKLYENYTNYLVKSEKKHSEGSRNYNKIKLNKIQKEILNTLN